MLNVRSREGGSYMMNTIYVWCGKTREAVLFDPGFGAVETLLEMDKQDLTLKYLVNTHGHVDHIAENHVVKTSRDVPLLIHTLDRPKLLDPMLNLSAFIGESVISPDADREIDEGERLRVGEEEFILYHVPGHSPGSLVFYSPGILIAGDTLFYQSIGRTDFPDSDEFALHESIRGKLYTLPPETIVYPGHGPTTTIGEERKYNPFVRG